MPPKFTGYHSFIQNEKDITVEAMYNKQVYVASQSKHITCGLHCLPHVYPMGCEQFDFDSQVFQKVSCKTIAGQVSAVDELMGTWCVAHIIIVLGC